MIRQLKKKVLNFLEIYHFLLFKKKPKEKSKILILGKSKKLFEYIQTKFPRFSHGIFKPP